MKKNISLQAVFDTLVEKQVIVPKRIGPIRTALKQYSAILGYAEYSKCPVSACFRPDKIRNTLIDERAPTHLGMNALRNLKNNVSFVLRKAEAVGIASPPAELASWKNSNDTRLMPKRNEHIMSPSYKLKNVPSQLEEEICVYERWSTSITNRNRPRTLRKRAISFRQHRDTILQACGYFVKHRKMSESSLRLLTIVEPKNAFDYVEWRAEQQGKYTKGVDNALAHIAAIAHYLELASQCAEQKLRINQWRRELRDFRASLGVPQKVHNQSKRWLSLTQLEMVGKSIYPLNAVRLNELKRATRFAIAECANEISFSASATPAPKRGYRTFRLYSFRVLQSLLIRLLIRIPLRQRNLREMLWNPLCPEEGQNLYKKDGVWRLRFSGSELKVSEIKGQIRSIAYVFPTDLIQLLEEWLYKWRQITIGGQKGPNIGTERATNGQEFVFLNCRGRPLKLTDVTTLFERATFKFTGVAVNPHMIRTIYATEYIKSTRNFADAAYMLGDTVETVIKTYAKLLDEDCSKRANEWINKRLQEEPPDAHRRGNGSSQPALEYPRGR